MDRNNLYKDFEEELDFVTNNLHSDEDLSPTETITVSALERQKAQLESQRVKVEQQIKDVIEKINQLDAQIARMKAT